MQPYRENALKKGTFETVWVKSLWWRLRRFRFARKHLGGHWERHWLPPGPHADRSDNGEWSPWIQVSKCTEPDTARCCNVNECEEWGCTFCTKVGVSRHGINHLHYEGTHEERSNHDSHRN